MSRLGLRGLGRVRCAPRALRGGRWVSSVTPALDVGALRGTLQGTAQLFAQDAAWHARLDAANVALDAPMRARRVVFVGAASSGTAQVVDALLAEPHNADVSRALQAKSEAAARTDRGLVIRYGEQSSADDTLLVPLPWLRDGLEIVEMLDPTDSAESLETLYGADAVFFVTDLEAMQGALAPVPAQRTLALLERFAGKPETSVLINLPSRTVGPDTPAPAGASVAKAAEMPDWAALGRTVRAALTPRILNLLASQAAPLGSAPLGSAPPGVHVVSSSLAAHAKALLAPPPAAAAPDGAARTPPVRDAWLAFADDFRAARFPPLYNAVVRPSDPTTRVAYLARAAIEQASAAEAAEEERLRLANGYAAVLASSAERAMSTLAENIVPDSAGGEQPSAAHVRKGDASASVAGFLADSRHEVEATLASRFAWYKLPMRIDELRLALLYAVGRSFGTDQEVRLAYEAGQLRALAATETQRTTEALADLARGEEQARTQRDSGALADAQPSFNSATLQNALGAFRDAQLAPILSPTSLSEPVVRRRRQLLEAGGPIDQLTARAQRATLHVYAFLGATYTLCGYGALAHKRLHVAAPPDAPLPVQTWADFSASSWTPWTPPAFLSELAGYADVLALAPSTAGGTALLATAAAAWYLQGRWASAKRKFWKDWDRIVSAVDRDAKSEVTALLRYVFGAPLGASRALRDAAVVRAVSHEERVEQLRRLRAALPDERK